MGWNARMKSGIILRQSEGARFCDIDLHQVEEMWLDGLDRISINRRYCPGFVEFLFYEVASASPGKTEKVAEFLGWSNGDVEFVIGVSREKHNFHPLSRLK